MNRSKPVHGACRVLLLAICGALLSSGCRSHHHPNDMARARFINTVSGQDLSVWLGDKLAIPRARFRTSSGFVALPAGRYDLHITSPDKVPLTTERSILLEAGESYTVVAAGASLNTPGSSVLIEVLHDGVALPPPNDSAVLRFASAAPEFNDLELALNNVIAVDGVPFGTQSRRITLPPGDYDVKLWLAAGASPLLGPMPIHLAAGHAYTMVAMGRSENDTLALQLFDDGE